MCVNSHSWYFFDKNGCRYPLELVGEGTKKLALLRWLLLTRALNSGPSSFSTNRKPGFARPTFRDFGIFFTVSPSTEFKYSSRRIPIS